MSALVVMMLMLYALMVALALMLWAALNLRARRPVAPPADELTRARPDALPEVPAAFAAKPAPATEAHETRTQPHTNVGRASRTAAPNEPERRRSDPHQRESVRREPTARQTTPATPAQTPAQTPGKPPAQPPSTPNEGRVSFSRVRVVHRRDDDPPKKEPERDDAFERFRTAKDDIDF